MTDAEYTGGYTRIHKNIQWDINGDIRKYTREYRRGYTRIHKNIHWDIQGDKRIYKEIYRRGYTRIYKEIHTREYIQGDTQTRGLTAVV